MRSIFQKSIIILAFFITILGLGIIIYSLIAPPFNDFLVNTNPEFFSQFGSFIGGLVGVLFSLVAIVLLYKTLTAQQVSILNQKRIFELSQFETTFFNLIRTHQELVNGISGEFNELIFTNNEIHEHYYKAAGRSFFKNSKRELEKVLKSLEYEKFLGTYDKNFNEHVIKEIHDLYEEPNFINKDMAEIQEEIIIERQTLKLTNYNYIIRQNTWDNFQTLPLPDRLKVIYELFFERYRHVIGHYYRHLYHIIKYVSDFGESNKNNKDIAAKYIGFIQAQMSSYELMLLFYNSLLFPKHLELLIDNNFLENLYINDLIREEHNCIDEIKLKS